MTGEWLGITSFDIESDDGSIADVTDVHTARRVDGEIEIVTLDPEDRVDGEPKADSAFEQVGLCNYREYTGDHVWADEFELFAEVYAAPDGRWMLVDRLDDVAEYEGGEQA